MPRPKSQKTLDKEAAEKAKIDAAADNSIADEKDEAAGTVGVATEELKAAEEAKAVSAASDAASIVTEAELVIAEAVTKTAMAEEKVREADANIAEADAKVAKAEVRVAEANAKVAEVEAAAKAKCVLDERAAKLAAEEEAANDVSPWHVVREQSDEDTTIEVCNVSTGFQMPAAILLRCRVDGQIVGDVKLMQGLTVKQIKGLWKLQ